MQHSSLEFEPDLWYFLFCGVLVACKESLECQKYSTDLQMLDKKVEWSKTKNLRIIILVEYSLCVLWSYLWEPKLRLFIKFYLYVNLTQKHPRTQDHSHSAIRHTRVNKKNSEYRYLWCTPRKDTVSWKSKKWIFQQCWWTIIFRAFWDQNWVLVFVICWHITFSSWKFIIQSYPKNAIQVQK